MSDTPRTKELESRQKAVPDLTTWDAWCEMRDFARQLERELTRMKAERDVAVKCAERLAKAMYDIHNEDEPGNILDSDGFTKSYHKGSVADRNATSALAEWVRVNASLTGQEVAK